MIKALRARDILYLGGDSNPGAALPGLVAWAVKPCRPLRRSDALILSINLPCRYHLGRAVQVAGRR